jgi:hypothetical protein
MVLLCRHQVDKPSPEKCNNIQAASCDKLLDIINKFHGRPSLLNQNLGFRLNTPASEDFWQGQSVSFHQQLFVIHLLIPKLEFCIHQSE